MDGTESLDNNALRRRITDLEEDLQNAEAAKVEAEMRAHKKAQHAHHVRFSFILYMCGPWYIFWVREGQRAQGSKRSRQLLRYVVMYSCSTLTILLQPLGRCQSRNLRTHRHSDLCRTRRARARLRLCSLRRLRVRRIHMPLHG
jgi:hypothetical protein